MSEAKNKGAVSYANLDKGDEVVIHVTVEDVENGTACSAGRCPIALALLRRGREWFGPRVDCYADVVSRRSMSVFAHGVHGITLTAAESDIGRVREFVMRFDRSAGNDRKFRGLTFTAVVVEKY